MALAGQVLALSLLASCALAPSSIPREPYLVLVKSVQLPDREWLPWYTRFADHCWVDFKDDRGWWRAEWNRHTPEVQLHEMVGEVARADVRWEMKVQVHSVTGGEDAKEIAARIHRRAREYPYQDRYHAFPGPNSNTFVAWLARECGIHVELPTTALGEHYVATFRAGLTTTGTGLEVETYPLGIEVGLKEGACVYLFGLPIGVGIWPPSVKLPFLPAIPLGFFGRGPAE